MIWGTWKDAAGMHRVDFCGGEGWNLKHPHVDVRLTAGTWEKVGGNLRVIRIYMVFEDKDWIKSSRE